MLLSLGYRVYAIDREPRLSDVDHPDLTVAIVDLEGGTPAPLMRPFGGIVVTNYLHRPLLPVLVNAVAPGGILLYETFAAGNERFGRPSRADFLLRRGELLEVVRGLLDVVAFEDVVEDGPRPRAVQRIAAVAPESGARPLSVPVGNGPLI
ncbi:MAG: hypothetical protein NVSMB4_05550 [Acidimicrobiales bacterium]